MTSANTSPDGLRRPVIVVRPEPGNAATCAALAAAGLDPVSQPLFTVAPIDWRAPDADGFDKLLLTSANAARHAGDALRQYTGLECYCVGPATADAARAAGLSPHHAGDDATAARGAQAMLDAQPRSPARRWLWLCGEDRTPLTLPPPSLLKAVAVYRTVPLPLPDTLRPGAVILLHSRAAARALAILDVDRATHALVAGSDAIAAAAGGGWRGVHVATSLGDHDMVAKAQSVWQERLGS